MKLIKCEACEKEISKMAKACPNCGELSKEAKRSKASTDLMKAGFALTFITPFIILFLLIIVGILVQ